MDGATGDAVLGVVTVAGLAALLWYAVRGVRSLNLHANYVAGDVEAVESALEEPERILLNTRVCMFIALGRYGAALEAASEAMPRVLESVSQEADPIGALVRINVSEALAELGRFDEAARLLSRLEATEPFLATGAATSRAWILTMQGQPEAALALLAPGRPEHLGRDYAAEPAMMQAWCLLDLGKLDEARTWLDRARKLVVRASSDRNLLLHEARWFLMSGDVEGARRCWTAARDHGWTKQGGTGMLWFGDTLAARGHPEWAREVWGRVAQQDPESWAAKQALERVGATAMVDSQKSA